MLKDKLKHLSHQDLVEVYETLWLNADKFTDESLRQHIQAYIIFFYQYRAKKTCREKCHKLIDEIKKH